MECRVYMFKATKSESEITCSEHFISITFNPMLTAQHSLFALSPLAPNPRFDMSIDCVLNIDACGVAWRCGWAAMCVCMHRSLSLSLRTTFAHINIYIPVQLHYLPIHSGVKIHRIIYAMQCIHKPT